MKSIAAPKYSVTSGKSLHAGGDAAAVIVQPELRLLHANLESAPDVVDDREIQAAVVAVGLEFGLTVAGQWAGRLQFAAEPLRQPEHVDAALRRQIGRA